MAHFGDYFSEAGIPQELRFGVSHWTHFGSLLEGNSSPGSAIWWVSLDPLFGPLFGQIVPRICDYMVSLDPVGTTCGGVHTPIFEERITVLGQWRLKCDTVVNLLPKSRKPCFLGHQAVGTFGPMTPNVRYCRQFVAEVPETVPFRTPNCQSGAFAAETGGAGQILVITGPHGKKPQPSMVAWLAGCTAGWLASWLPGWLAAWLPGWRAGCLAGWLAGRLAGCMAGWLEIVVLIP